MVTKQELFESADRALRAEGWAIERTPGRNTSERRIVRGNESHLIAIRTSTNTWFGFGPSGVMPENYDFVVVSSVDQEENPTEIRVHKIPGDKVAEAIQRHREARRARGGQGELNMNWLSLYSRDGHPRRMGEDPGGGLGLDFTPIYRWRLGEAVAEPQTVEVEPDADPVEKLRQILAIPGVRPENVRISIQVAI
jgi:hypothetical protein